MKNLICLILTLTLLLAALCGCSKPAESGDLSTAGGSESASEESESSTENPELPYTVQQIDFPFGVGHIFPSAFLNEKLWFVAPTYIFESKLYTGDFSQTYNKLISVNISDGNYEILQDFGPFDEENSPDNIFESAFGDTCFVKMKHIYDCDTADTDVLPTEQPTDRYEYSLLSVDESGLAIEELLNLEAEFLQSGDFNGFGITMITDDSLGNWYISFCDEVRVFDSDFTELCRFSFDLVSSLFRLKDGTVAAAVETGGKTSIQIFDPGTMSFNKAYSFRYNFVFPVLKNSCYDVIYHCYTDDGANIYGLAFGGEPELLARLSDYGLSELGITNLSLTEIGDIVLVGDNGYYQKAPLSAVFILKKCS